MARTARSGDLAPAPTAPALGIAVPNFGVYLPGTGQGDLAKIAVMAEAAAIARVVADQVVVGSDISTYPWGNLSLDPSAMADGGRNSVALRVGVSLPLVKVPGSSRANLESSLATVLGPVEAGATDFSLPVPAFCSKLDEMPEFFSVVAQLFAQHTAGIEAQG